MTSMTNNATNSCLLRYDWRVDLLALRYFQAVARREHLSRAADDLRVAQPSLSRTIARLEAELGVPLFDRQGRRLRLNRFGTSFLARVDRALGELEDARRELADLAGVERGRVAVASETLLTVAALVGAFRAQHPEVEIRLHQSAVATLTDQLRTGEVDLGFVSQPVDDPSFATLELVHEQVLLAVPRGHPLGQWDRVPVAALANEPFITLRPGHWQRSLADDLFAEAGVTPVPVGEGDEPAATLELVGVGLGVTLVPAMGTRTWDDPRIVTRPLDTARARRVLRVIWRRDAYLPAAARRLRETAVDHFSGSSSPG